jgi:hypothetical protein
MGLIIKPGLLTSFWYPCNYPLGERSWEYKVDLSHNLPTYLPTYLPPYLPIKCNMRPILKTKQFFSFIFLWPLLHFLFYFFPSTFCIGRNLSLWKVCTRGFSLQKPFFLDFRKKKVNMHIYYINCNIENQIATNCSNCHRFINYKMESSKSTQILVEHRGWRMLTTVLISNVTIEHLKYHLEKCLQLKSK